MTVRLRPEALGEVRVVLTTRRGELQVSLAASGDAHRALAEGAPELRRLLEAVGSPDARVLVRDLPGGAGPADPGTAPGPGSGPGSGPGTPNGAAATRSDLPGDGTGGPGAGAGRPGGDAPGRHTPHPPARGVSTAMDGTLDATTPLRRTETVTRARTGLDVTM